jgi:phosphotransferase system enzyme I (PtsI)
MDLGGDKFTSEIDFTDEINPAMGLRAIRLCLKQPEIFKSQLRAILRASAQEGNVQLMFPMISGIQEIVESKKILREVMNELDQKNIPYNKNIPIGIMIEIPSAVAVSDLLAEHVDFFSIGTNDLIQYTLAIDRVNEHVAYMYQPFHPAIIRMLNQVVISAKRRGIGVYICGEMAGDPLCIPIMLGLGIEELSMNPPNIPFMKKVIRSVSMKDIKSAFQGILKLDTALKVKDYLTDIMLRWFPELEEHIIHE